MLAEEIGQKWQEKKHKTMNALKHEYLQEKIWKFSQIFGVWTWLKLGLLNFNANCYMATKVPNK